MKKLTRRDFLKVSAAISAGAALARLPLAARRRETGGAKNIIILLFDAMSARHLSIYGYERKTTPNFARLAERSLVYHSHYSSANLTSPGTATTFTGLYPWKHRAFDHAGLIKRDLADQNIFNLLGPDYFRTGFAQNLWADLQMGQFSKAVDRHLPPTSFSVVRDSLLVENFGNDRALSWFAFPDFLTSLNMPASLLGGYLNAYNTLRKLPYYRYGFPQYPKGIPTTTNSFIPYVNEDIFNGIQAEIQSAEKTGTPYFSYFHFFSPHEPYMIQKDFIKAFENDGYVPIEKPQHVLGGKHQYKDVVKHRLHYDQLIANLDADFGLLLDTLEAQGVLDDSYLVITSDHGQLFERGDHGHGTPLMYEGVIQIPLIISVPGQSTRRDIYTPTINIDLVPSLLKAAGRQIPEVLDGQLLPGLGGPEDDTRSLYSIIATADSAFLPITFATIAIRKGDYKLIYYLGYPGLQHDTELYNIRQDPEEMRDLVSSEMAVASRLKEELLAALDAANQPYRHK